MTNDTERTTKAGRPRAVADQTPGTSPRDQILLAAAELFVGQGFGTTSTRAIAEAVGIRQASLYYHFAGKDEILAELLDRSVRPSIEIASGLVEAVGTGLVEAVGTGADADADAFRGSDTVGGAVAFRSAVALRGLAVADATLLATTPHNIGSLYLLPEVQGARFAEFRQERENLRRCYGRLGARVRPLAADPEALPDEALLGHLVIHMVESVIQLRRAEVDPIDVDAVADACLRLAGLDARTVAAVRAAV